MKITTTTLGLPLFGSAVLGRAGVVFVDSDPHGDGLWVGGNAVPTGRVGKSAVDENDGWLGARHRSAGAEDHSSRDCHE